MIIKSTTRKDGSFRQLVGYISEEEKYHGKHDEKEVDDSRQFEYFQNMDLPDGHTREDIARAFSENNALLKQRKNGIQMVHDIMSFAPGDNQEITASMLEDMAARYLEMRSPNGIGFARPHFHHDHVHIHIMHSANERDSQKRTRVSKEQFIKIRREMERYQLEQYPELTKSYVHSRDKERVKAKEAEHKKARESFKEQFIKAEKEKQNRQKKSAEQQMKFAAEQKERLEQQREKSEYQKLRDEMHQGISESLAKASDLEQLRAQVEKIGYTVYERNGIPTGITYDNKKYRFSTLLKTDKEKEKIKLMISNQREVNRAEEYKSKLDALWDKNRKDKDQDRDKGWER